MSKKFLSKSMTRASPPQLLRPRHPPPHTQHIELWDSDVWQSPGNKWFQFKPATCERNHRVKNNTTHLAKMYRHPWRKKTRSKNMPLLELWFGRPISYLTHRWLVRVTPPPIYTDRYVIFFHRHVIFTFLEISGGSVSWRVGIYGSRCSTGRGQSDFIYLAPRFKTAGLQSEVQRFWPSGAQVPMGCI